MMCPLLIIEKRKETYQTWPLENNFDAWEQNRYYRVAYRVIIGSYMLSLLIKQAID